MKIISKYFINKCIDFRFTLSNYNDQIKNDIIYLDLVRNTVKNSKKYNNIKEKIYELISKIDEIAIKSENITNILDAYKIICSFILIQDMINRVYLESEIIFASESFL